MTPSPAPDPSFAPLPADVLAALEQEQTVEAALATPGDTETTASAIASRNVFPATRMLGSSVMVIHLTNATSTCSSRTVKWGRLYNPAHRLRNPR